MKIFLVHLVLLYLCFGCFAVQKNFRIYSGTYAIPGEFPHMLTIREAPYKRHRCGASIVNDRWALTAAHCIIVEIIADGIINVTAGAWDLRETSNYEQTVLVDRAIVHPDYTGDYTGKIGSNDLGMLHLSESLVWNDWVKPVVLPQPNTRTEGYAVISGWGLLSEKPITFAKILQRAVMRIIGVDQCNYELSKFGAKQKLYYDTDFCTEAHNGQTFVKVCPYDSGSPIGIWDGDDFIQLGITVWTVSDCGVRNGPSVFVRVSGYIEWIHHNMEY